MLDTGFSLDTLFERYRLIPRETSTETPASPACTVIKQSPLQNYLAVGALKLTMADRTTIVRSVSKLSIVQLDGPRVQRTAHRRTTARVNSELPTATEREAAFRQSTTEQ